MKRRDFLKTSVLAGAAMAAADTRSNAQAIESREGAETMKAGFARVKITPPTGATMMGFGGRDMDHGCEGTHDDVYVRALFLEHAGDQALIMGYDLCFLGREETDRYKGAIGRVMDLLPRQIFMNTSHNHVGPSVGTWYSAGYETPDRLYLNDLEGATVKAATEARANLEEVTVWAGVTKTALPVNRRRKNEQGLVENRPNPEGLVYDRLPICLFKNRDDAPVCLLFSVSTHPSMMSGWMISAEYPGAAMRILDQHFGTNVSLFLQGVGGDSKPRVIGEGVDYWRPGTWELMEEAGNMIARETRDALEKGLRPVKPALRTASVEMEWDLEAAPSRSEFEAIIAATPPENRAKNVRYLWAAKVIERLERGDTLPTSVTLTAHGIRLGEGLRLLGIEGEATAPWGYLIDDFYGGGVTFPLGYTDGTGLYLPASNMIDDGGYEVVSYWEYGLPAPLAKGMEDKVLKALRELRERGIT